MRRLFLILILIAVVAGAGALLFAFRKQPVVEQPQNGSVTELTPTEIPVTILPAHEPEITAIPGKPVPRLVADLLVTDYWVDTSDRTLYAANENGVISSISAAGSATELMKAPISSLISAAASPRPPLALLRGIGSDGASLWMIVDPIIKKVTMLPLDTTAAAWSPDGKELMLLRVAQKSTDTLPTYQLHGYTVATAKSRLLGQLPLRDVLLEWVTPTVVLITTPASDQASGNVWRYDINKKTFVSLTPSATDLELHVQPAAGFGLQLTGGGSPTLSLTDLIGNKVAELSFSLPEKCVISRATLFCGSPKNIRTRSQFAEQYRRRVVLTNDAFTATTLNPNAIRSPETLYEPEIKAGSVARPIDATHLETAGNTLYFINRWDERLYSFELPVK